MALLLVWLGLAFLLVFWSCGVWLLHAVAAWAAANAGALSGVPDLVQALGIPQWIAPWIPPEFAAVWPAMAASLEPLVAWLVQWMPAVAGGLAVLAWVTWALGALGLLLAGVVATVLLVVLRRKTRGGGDGGGGQGLVDAVRTLAGHKAVRDLAGRRAGKWLRT